jgi:hypothetical protein
MVQFCTFVTGAIIVAAFFDVVDWATVGWVVLGLFILNGFVAWSSAKDRMVEEERNKKQ